MAAQEYEDEDDENGLDDEDELEGDELEEEQPKPAWPLNITIPSKEELEGLNEVGSED
jgi:hypothetical protein